MKDSDKEMHLKKIRIQLCDHLFERGHTITKSMVDDASDFLLTYAISWYEQGEMSTNNPDNLNQQGK